MSEETLRGYIGSMMDGQLFIGWLDLSLESVESGRDGTELLYREEFGNPGGTHHGGIVAMVMDQTAAMAVQTETCDISEGLAGPSIDIRVSYVRPISQNISAS